MTKKNTTTNTKKSIAKKSTATAKKGTAKKSTASKSISKVASATVDKSYSFVFRNDGKTRIVNSKGITVATVWGTKTITFLTASDEVKKALMSAYKFSYSATTNHGNNKHMLSITATSDITREAILKTVFHSHSVSKDIKAQEKTDTKTVAKSTASAKSTAKKSTSSTGKKTTAKKSTSKTDKKTIDVSKTNTINSEVLKSIVSEVS